MPISSSSPTAASLTKSLASAAQSWVAVPCANPSCVATLLVPSLKASRCLSRSTALTLIKGHGPALLYQIGQHDTRILIDVKSPLPSDLKVRSPTRVYYCVTRGRH